MRSGVLRTLTVIGIVVLTVAGVALAKSSGVKKFATDVNVITSNQGTKFEGNVTSDSPKCLKNRAITLFYDTADQEVGTAMTDADGNWEIEGNFTAGLYHGEAAPRMVGKHTKCKKGKGPSREA
jgi:hypothetical protein